MPKQQSMNGPNGVNEICPECGEKYGMHLKDVMGIWLSHCAICGRHIGVANALHDFGMSDVEVEQARACYPDPIG